MRLVIIIIETIHLGKETEMNVKTRDYGYLVIYAEAGFSHAH